MSDRKLDHPYDEPNLDSLQFLYAVMQDATVPLQLRIEAANHLMPFTEHRPGLRQDVATVRIQFMPGFNDAEDPFPSAKDFKRHQ